MKLRYFSIENAASFGSLQILRPNDLTILIGPNGGGKTNLLTIVSSTLRTHFLNSWTNRAKPGKPADYVMQGAPAPAPHANHAKEEQRIHLTLEASAEDIENIRLVHNAAANPMAPQLEQAKHWTLAQVREGDTFDYAVVNNKVEAVSDPGAQLFLDYLKLYELDAQLRAKRGKAPLTLPLLTRPVPRPGVDSRPLSLAEFDESNIKSQLDSTGSGDAFKLALGRLAEKHRTLLQNDDGRAAATFEAEPEVAALTAALAELDFTWKLVCTDPKRNTYSVSLKKGGIEYELGQASTGERELISQLFAIYGLNVRNALLVVDEAELHLHPSWQGKLFGVFQRLVDSTGNQLLLSTHSPRLVQPDSLDSVVRVFMRKQESQLHQLAPTAHLPQRKHLFSIINSHNNERLFFAEQIVLVEGISDRLFLEAVFKKLGLLKTSSDSLDILPVGGKGFFPTYEKLLTALDVPYFVVADLDYVKQVGTAAVKALLKPSFKKIGKEVIKSQSSHDGTELARELESAVNSGDLATLKTVWERIKETRTTFSPDALTHAQQQTLNSFIEGQRTKSLFILKRGAVEEYLPPGHDSKDLEKLIATLETDFWPAIAPEAQEELRSIASHIKATLAKRS